MTTQQKFLRDAAATLDLTQRKLKVAKTLPAKAIEAAVESASTLDDLKRIGAETYAVNVMNDDGTIRGLYYCASSGKRGATLQIAIRQGTPNVFTTSMIVDGKDFHTVYRDIVNAISAYYKLPEGSELSMKMHESAGAFLDKNGLQLKQVWYEQVVKPQPA